jgi:hypothetical protein
MKMQDSTAALAASAFAGELVHQVSQQYRFRGTRVLPDGLAEKLSRPENRRPAGGHLQDYIPGWLSASALGTNRK